MAKTVAGLGRDPSISSLGESSCAYTEKSLGPIRALLARTIAHAADLPALVGGKRVLIKPNLVRPDPRNPCAVVTDERVLVALIELVRQAGARRILVGDNPGYGLSLESALSQMDGFIRAIRAAGAEPVFFDLEEKVEIPIPNAFVFERMLAPKAVVEADVYINLPKMKTHMHTLVTLGIKNQYGLVLDGQRMLCHRNDISPKIVDILRVIRPQLTVVDALVAVQGQAPLSGSVVPDMNMIVAGTDVAAVDAVCCELMGIDPMEVDMLRLVRQENLGVTELADIEVRGERIADCARRFTRPVVSPMGAYPQARCLEGGACRGCLSALRHSLDKLHAEGSLTGRDPVSIYVGSPMPESKLPPNEIGERWRFGSCAANLVFDHRDPRPTAHFIPGCPPHILEFYKAYKKRYCEGGGKKEGKKE